MNQVIIIKVMLLSDDGEELHDEDSLWSI